MIKWVTPTLAVCDTSDMPVVLSVDEVDEAVSWIDQGGTAYVDLDATAWLVLAALGLSDAEITDRLHFANHGEVLVP